MLKNSWDVLQKYTIQYSKHMDKINRMLKKASSKAAGSEVPGAYMRYVRRLSD